MKLVFFWVLFDFCGFDMGGCFPCFGSSNKETGKQVVKKESFKDASAPQSIHLSKVNSGMYSSFFVLFALVFLNFGF